MPKRSAEEVCIEYAIAAAEVRRLTKIILPGECTKMAGREFQPGWPDSTTPIDPCISKLFSLRSNDYSDYQAYLEDADEIKEEMCDRCLESLKAAEDRKDFRKRLGFAKRSVEAVGKRLAKEQGQ